MQVETFEVAETTSAGVECDAESIALINSLGLGGQQKRLQPSDSGAVALNPYRRMTREEEGVYKILMPVECLLADYEDGPIPLRVLQVAAHAKEHFKRLVVWCPRTGPKDDPLLIGCQGDFMWDAKRHILARWGDCLLPFEKLAEKATVVARQMLKGRLEEISAMVAADLATCDRLPDIKSIERANSLPAFSH